MLYSGLVFPGVGQWILGQRRKAVLIVVWITLLVAALFVRLFVLVYDMLYPSLSQFQLPPELLSEVHKQAYLDNWWLLLLIIAIWIGSVVDAYVTGKSLERQSDVSPHP